MKVRSPLESMRRFCVTCQGDSPQTVTDCTDMDCPFHSYRHGTALSKGRHAPLRACKRYCAEYCQVGAGRDEVVSCGGDKAVLGPCQVFPFRLGQNPNYSDAVRTQRSQRAQERVSKGTPGFVKTAHHTPRELPGSPEASRPDLAHVSDKIARILPLKLPFGNEARA